MADTHVLVPMQLDAMVLNTESSLATPFLRFEMEYENLNSFGSPEPPPFAGGSTQQPKAGIYLHWTLPQALRHGDDDGQTSGFPLIPNRWLIVRTQAGLPPAQAVKAWLIESDYVYPAEQAQAQDGTPPPGAAFVSPTGLTESGQITPIRIGRATLLSTLESTEPQPTPYLQAIGPGNVYFSAFEPGLTNVLAFIDPVTANDDSTPIDQATFTYALVGWYSDPTHDPLAGTTWSASTDPNLAGAYVNCKFPWHVFAVSNALPTQMLVHAISPGVPWDRNAENPPAPSYPTDIANKVRVSFGNTAIDALSAIVRQDRGSQTEADMLEAFQYGLLETFDQPGSAEALNVAIRQHWYGASSGGTLWTIAAAERTTNTSLPIPESPPITPAQAAALAAINVQQRELDRQQRILDSMQWTLFGLWWMNQWQNVPANTVPDSDLVGWLIDQLPFQIGIGSTPVDPNGTDPSQEPWYAWKVNAQINLVKQLMKTVTDSIAAFTGTTDPPDPRLQPIAGTDLVLKAANMPQYFASQDPVVLVTGLGRATNFDPVDGVLCRLASQAVAALTVNNQTYTAASIAGQIPVLSDPRSLLPDGTQALHIESLFLSAALFAQDILGNVGQKSAVEQAIAALPKPASGAQFPPTDYAFAEWQQPWIPLLLDWRVVVLRDPAYAATVGTPTCTFNQGNWQFDGSDYQWIGPKQAGGGNFDEGDSGQMTLSGRTFVTPHLAISLANQLDTYVRTHAFRDPNLEKLLQDLDTYIDQVAGQDILSQRLSGLLGMMAERGGTQTIAPSGDITSLLGDAQHGIPVPYPDPHATYTNAVWDFAPLGGSFYVITGLTVIDAFGRTIDLLLANYSTNPPTDRQHAEDYFYPIEGRNVQAPTAKPPAPGQGISTDPTTRMIQVTPATVQPSQLRFRLISNDLTNTDIDERGDANPICGWVVPNHLDRSLAFYAPDGTAWGELYLSAQVGGHFIPAWQRDPTNPNAPATVDAIPNPYIRGMLTAIWNRADNGTAFNAFLQVIDETLWSIHPPGDKNDYNLSVLVGRPLAIVRAELSLQLQGLQLANQDWWNLFTQDSVDTGDPTQPAQLAAVDGGVSSFLWPIRLGSQALRDDGLIGYFVDDPANLANSFNTCNVVNLPPSLQVDYLKQVGVGNFPKLCFVDDSVASRDPAKQQILRLTMLVDPRGSIHAFSGLLPVVDVTVPTQFVTPALNTISYVFRSGPLMTVPDAVRVPRPAENKGTWGWFDYVLTSVVPLTPSDSKVSIATTTPLIKEGWLKFTPNPPHPPNPPAPVNGPSPRTPTDGS
jgi:hypothetical protein